MANSILSNNPTQLLTKAKVNVSDFVSTGTITINATTTAPTKGTVVEDSIGYSRSGGNAIVELKYRQSAGGTAGVGNYLFTLPSGLQFDSRVNFNTSTGTALANYEAYPIIEVQNGGTIGSGFVMPYDSTRFRVLLFSAQTGAGAASTAAYNWLGQNIFDLSVVNISIKGQFSVPIQGWSSEAEFLAPLVQPKTALVYETSTVNIPSLANSIQTRQLNEVSGDTDIVKLNGNQFTLGAGQYRLEYYGIGYQCGYSAVFIYDVTNSQYVSTEKYHVYLGPATDTQVSVSDYDFVSVDSDTVFELRQYTNLAVGTGLSNAGAFSSPGNPATVNKNAQVKITKLL